MEIVNSNSNGCSLIANAALRQAALPELYNWETLALNVVGKRSDASCFFCLTIAELANRLIYSSNCFS